MSRRVMVVGGSAGLGAAIAVLHRRRGDDVLVVARRIENMVALGEYSDEEGVGEWRSEVVDLAAPDAVPMVTSKGNPDLVYLVAAIADECDVETMFTVNLRRQIELVRALDRSGRTIVLISSLAAIVPFPNLAAYGASKAALEAWAHAQEESSRGSLVVIRPGKFDSELLNGQRPLRCDDLPWSQASAVVEAAERRSGLVTLGGWRDRLAARLAPVVGGRRCRRWLFGF